MIELYLSGAESPDAYQNSPSKSIGGYISSCKVVNGEVDGLFGGISEYSKINRKPEYSLIVMKNAGGNKSNVNINIDTPNGSYSVMRVAVVEPSSDSDGNMIFESIQDKWSAPFYADFNDNGSPFNIPLFESNKFYGIWIRRVISDSAYQSVSSESLNNAFEAAVPNQPDNVQNLGDPQYKPDSYEVDDFTLSISYT